MAEIQHHRDYTLILTAMLTGLRRAELAALCWRDYDAENARLRVVGKGSKPAVVVGVPSEAAAALSEWRERSRGGGGT